MTYQHYYELGKTFIREHRDFPTTNDIEHHIVKCPAILKQAFRDGVEDQTKTYWPAWPYTN